MMTLVFVLAIGVGYGFKAKEDEKIITRFGNGCVRGGWLGLLAGVIVIMNVDAAAQMDFSIILPAMAVAWLTPIYGCFLNWFLCSSSNSLSNNN